MSVLTNNTIQPSSGQALTIKDEGGTASITVATNGEATFAENIKITNGKGIDFSNATDAATGETVTSSILDDYEEGTFTVTFSGNSVNNAETFSYTKIGNQVTVVGRMVFSIGGNGPYTITTSNTLPFTPKTNTSAILVSTMNRLIDNATDGVQLITNNGNATLFYKRVTTSADAYDATNLNAVQKTNDSRTDAYSTFVGTYLTS